MKILVLVKQVPAPGSVRFLPQLNRIAREGVASLLNPLDGRALEIALQLAGASGEVVAATMGPPQAREVLEEACARGAARGVHLVDPMFAGADTLATARAFASLVARERPDLVLGGRTTLDGATAQVVPQLAELAGLSLATEADTVTVADGHVEITRTNGRTHERLRAPLPAAVSVAAAPAPARPATARPDPVIEQLGAESLGGDPSSYGIRGSATYVSSVAVDDRVRAGESVEDPVEWLARVVALSGAPTPRPGPLPDGTDGGRPAPASRRELWVVVERDRDAVADVSLEALAAARAVCPRLGAATIAVCFGAADDALVGRLSRAGAEAVRVLASPEIDPDSTSTFVDALCAALELEQPLAVLGGWTVAQRDWLPRAAARLAVGMTGDVVGLEVATRPGSSDVLDLVWLKPAWSGAAVASVVARTVPSFGTLRPGAIAPLELPERPLATHEVRLGARSVPGAAAGRVVDRVLATGAGALVEGAHVVVLAGSGLDGDGAEVARSLARRLDGALACLPDAPIEGATPISAATHSLSPRLVVLVGDATSSDLLPVRLAGRLASVATGAPRLAVDLALRAAPGVLRAALGG